REPEARRDSPGHLPGEAGGNEKRRRGAEAAPPLPTQSEARLRAPLPDFSLRGREHSTATARLRKQGVATAGCAPSPLSEKVAEPGKARAGSDEGFAGADLTLKGRRQGGSCFR